MPRDVLQRIFKSVWQGHTSDQFELCYGMFQSRSILVGAGGDGAETYPHCHSSYRLSGEPPAAWGLTDHHFLLFARALAFEAIH